MTTDVFQSDEDATLLDGEERQELIPSLTTRAELNQVERININEARLWAMRPRVLKRADLLTDGFAHELHRQMFDQVWRWAGQFRKKEKNLGWEVHRLTEGVHNALANAQAQLEHAAYPLHEIGVRLHHQLVVIHPWPNGNGCHARLMADIVIAARGGEELTWGAGAEIGTGGDVRQHYIDAVRQADQGNYAPLLAFAQG